MKKKESPDDELKDLSPFLRDLKREKDGFTLPADYFETLENAVFQKIDNSGNRRSVGMEALRGGNFKIRFFKPRLLMAIAASLTLAMAAWWFFQPSQETTPTDPMAMELTGEELETYVLENIQEFETDQLVHLSDDIIVPVETPQTTTPATKNKPSSDEISPEDVEDLLRDMSDEELEQLL